MPNLQPIFMNYKPQWYICGNWLWMIIKYVVSMITKLGDETLQPSVCLLIHPISQPTNHPFLISYECVWLSVCPSIHSSHIPIIMSPREAETECWLSLDNHLNCFLSFFHIHTRSPTLWWKIHPWLRPCIFQMITSRPIRIDRQSYRRLFFGVLVFLSPNLWPIFIYLCDHVLMGHNCLLDSFCISSWLFVVFKIVLFFFLQYGNLVLLIIQNNVKRILCHSEEA